ncbi:hypothetical protein [Mucilaginibacter sp. PAMB04168]|uniref:zinc finger domain-containing protein n=1 Tax=Mucilaginibacter sp. PAMB04168 TaxID=3138567 RepID=UPI0031F71284
MNSTSEAVAHGSLKCNGCGAVLHYVPGTRELQCAYCGESNPIISAVPHTAITAIEYTSFLKAVNELPQATDIKIVKCSSCGSETNFSGNEAAGKCGFCASPLIIQLGKGYHSLKPHYILPFRLNEQEAGQKFRDWLADLWFAPNDIVKEAKANVSLKGIYLPYWTYDCNTVSQYTGERGEYYYTKESYTVTVNGKTETRTREVRHTRWYSASGTVYCDFEDVTIPASKSLPAETLEALNPWDFADLQIYDERYLSGLSAETFQIKPDDGLEAAKIVMDSTIESAIRNDIGGDEQRIFGYQNQYLNLAIKYVLLPVWVSAYTYDRKVFQFSVNACTGEVIGKRPYSAIKIILAVILGLIVVAAIILFIAYVKAQNEMRETEAALQSIGMLCL